MVRIPTLCLLLPAKGEFKYIFFVSSSQGVSDAPSTSLRAGKAKDAKPQAKQEIERKNEKYFVLCPILFGMASGASAIFKKMFHTSDFVRFLLGFFGGAGR
jgi:hypothetical protein